MANWANGDVVVVLGAGATRGAKFVTDRAGATHGTLPPLNADFFTQLQRVRAVKHQPAIDAVLADVIESFGANFSLTMEEYFTHIEALKHGAELLELPKTSRFSQTLMERKRERLLDALSAVLEESADVTKQQSPASDKPCEYHASLVAALRPPDTIISFNYDCVIDHALRTSGADKWSATWGYGLDSSRIDPVSAAVWSASPAASSNNKTIRLLKLHGSLNWPRYPDVASEAIRFRQKTFKQKGDKYYEIIPPEFFKRIEKDPFKTLWKRAASALRHARILALVGFSFPPTDQLVEALFRAALVENNRLERLIIVNPSREHRTRIRDVCSSRLSAGSRGGRGHVRLVQFDSFAEFSPHAMDLLR